ncbi:MAG: hypothetical protein F4060_15270 [Holophagales bacterium]|nr:hypothetical protein [Holophagales bacterium]MYG30842.1 hypothetical protein [Holophagales bacterium]MYI81291.1 hypothetical protein [Holophagales bacterium]
MRGRAATIAVVLCAIPAAAVGQVVTCGDCTHMASVYMGEGGFIATADFADKVSWIARCDGVTRTGEIAAGADGVVAALWTGDLACMAEGGGSFEVGPVMDGGWFWVTDADNSAVGGLVDKDVYEALKDDPADITSAGAGVTMMAGQGAVFVKETATGRVGIVPNILPEAPGSEMPLCGLRYTSATPPVPYQLLDDCRLDATFTMKISGPGDFGRTAEVGNVIYRNTQDDIRLTARMIAGGHISYRLNAGVVDPEWGAIDSKPLIASWGVYVHDAGPGATLASINVAQDATNFNEFIISPAAYCDDPAQRSYAPQIRISAGYVQNFIIPEMPNTTPPTFINRIITVRCAPPAAQQGQELVPDNPFPPEVD